MVSIAATFHHSCVAKPSPTYSKQPTLIRLGEEIRKERLLQMQSQEAFADKVGIDRSYFGGIERGEHNVALMNLLKISESLGVKLSELLARIGN